MAMANPLNIPIRSLKEYTEEACALVSSLCRILYERGWITSSGGGVTVKIPYDPIPKPRQYIVMSPSGNGALLARVKTGFVLDPQYLHVLTPNGDVLIEPHERAPLSTDRPIFMKAYQMCEAGAVIHSLAMESCIVTMMNPSATEFKITHMEMIKGIKGHGYHDELVVPIIENQPQESELADSFAKAIQAYPKATAVLVRNHGIFVWGDTWISALTQAECYHYLFDAAIRLNQMGIDWSTPEHGLLTIPRAFQQTLATGGLQTDKYSIESSKVEEDCENGVAGAVPIPDENSGKDSLIDANVTNVEAFQQEVATGGLQDDNCATESSKVEEDCENGVAGALPIPDENSGKDSVIDANVTNVEAFQQAVATGGLQDDNCATESSKVEEDCENGVAGAVPIPDENSGKDSVIDADVTNVEAFQQAAATGGLQDDNCATESSRKCIVLDMEGTVIPISFVTDILVPYARHNLRKHLISTYDTEATKEIIKLIRVQVAKDCKKGVAGAVQINPTFFKKDSVIDSIVVNVEAMVKAQRKIKFLNQLQDPILRTGFESKELRVDVFEDVLIALKKWHSEGKMVYIYSKRNREAQRLLFGYTTYGDLRRYLCGFFNPTVGKEKETSSYSEIAQFLGVDNESQILFVTGVYQEAVAAKAAGFEVLISIRPGNAPVPSDHGFKTITSFVEI